MSPELQNRYREAQELLAQAEQLFSAEECDAALAQVARRIREDLSGRYPLVLAVMGGAAVFTGRLLPLLDFPLDFDYIHITRYGDKLQGGAFQWLREPANVAGRDVLVLDDILDEGHTMKAVAAHILAAGAQTCRTAVFADKQISRPKPIAADYVGLSVPDRYVFGYGMDARQMWRNLGAVYAMKQPPCSP